MVLPQGKPSPSCFPAISARDGFGRRPLSEELKGKQVHGRKGDPSGIPVSGNVSNNLNFELGKERNWEPVKFLYNRSVMTSPIGCSQQLSCGTLHYLQVPVVKTCSYVQKKNDFERVWFWVLKQYAWTSSCPELLYSKSTPSCAFPTNAFVMVNMHLELNLWKKKQLGRDLKEKKQAFIQHFPYCSPLKIITAGRDSSRNYYTSLH